MNPALHRITVIGNALLFTVLFSYCGDSKRFANAPVTLVDSNTPFEWTADQPADVIRIHFSLKPGSKVGLWKQRCAAARAEGTRLPDRPVIAAIILFYENGRELPIAIRYGESIGANQREWWNEADGFIHHLSFAKLSAVALSDTLNQKYAVQYAMETPHAFPGSSIERIRLHIPDSLADGSRIGVFKVEPVILDAKPRVFFVAPWGNDQHDGSFDAPWGSLQYAAKAIDPGSTVYVRGGEYLCREPVLFDSLIATPEHPTRVIGWPGETGRFDFKATHLTYGSNPFGTGEGWLNLDQAMFSIDHCEHFVLKNLHLQHSRARGIGVEYGENISLLYNSVYLTFSPGIRFAHIDKGKIIGNTLIRPTSILMGPTQVTEAGSAPLVLDTGDSTFINPNQPLYMPEINAAQGERSRKPPMEGIDGAHFSKY